MTIVPFYNVRTVRITSMRQRLLFVCAAFIVAAGITLDAQWIPPTLDAGPGGAGGPWKPPDGPTYSPGARPRCVSGASP